MFDWALTMDQDWLMFDWYGYVSARSQRRRVRGRTLMLFEVEIVFE
jgi:hypothetical protein